MTPSLLLTSLDSALRPLIEAERGVLHVSESPEETISLLSVKPDGFRAVLQWQGEDGDDDTHGTSALARIAIVLQVARGLRADRGADAHRPADGIVDAKPILHLSDSIKKFLFGLVFVDEEAEEEGTLRSDIEHYKSGAKRQCFRFLSGDWLEIEGLEMRNYNMVFSIRYASRADD